MKAIDLLNKIANGEEVPKHILFDNTDYFLEEKSEIQCFIEECIGTGTLNDEIEVIEEPKKIEKLEPIYKIEQDMELDSVIAWQTVNNKIFQKKIDEIIDYINEMDKEK